MADASVFRSWVKAGLGLSFALLIGRVLGLCRELMIAGQYGADRTADQLILLLTFPDIMTNLLTAGAMTYVLVPEFRTLNNRDQKSLFWEMTAIVSIALFALTILLTVVKPDWFFAVFAPGLDEKSTSHLSETLPLYGMMIPLTGIASISTAWLRSKENFVLPALGTSLINGSIIIALFIIGDSHSPYLGVALAVLTAGILRYASQVLALKINLQVHNQSRSNLVANRHLFDRYCMALCAGGTFALFPLIAAAFASYVEGGIATLNYGLKLAQLPLVIAITIIPALILPKIAQTFDENRASEAQNLSRTSVYATLAIALAIALPAAYFAESVVSILFGWLGMKASALNQVTDIARIAFCTLPALGAVSHCMSVFNGIRKPFLPLVISFVALAAFILFAYILQPSMEVNGIIIAFALSYYLAWFLFGQPGAKTIGWQPHDFGFSGQTMRLLRINIAIGLIFVLLSYLLPHSLLLDALLGIMWCGSALYAAKVLMAKETTGYKSI